MTLGGEADWSRVNFCSIVKDTGQEVKSHQLLYVDDYFFSIDLEGSPTSNVGTILYTNDQDDETIAISNNYFYSNSFGKRKVPPANYGVIAAPNSDEKINFDIEKELSYFYYRPQKVTLSGEDKVRKLGYVDCKGGWCYIPNVRYSKPSPLSLPQMTDFPKPDTSEYDDELSQPFQESTGEKGDVVCDGSLTLEPGDYGTLEIKDNCSLTLESGTYRIKDFVYGAYDTIPFLNATGKNVTFFVENLGGDDTSDAEFNLIGGNSNLKFVFKNIAPKDKYSRSLFYFYLRGGKDTDSIKYIFLNQDTPGRYIYKVGGSAGKITVLLGSSSSVDTLVLSGNNITVYNKAGGFESVYILNLSKPAIGTFIGKNINVRSTNGRFKKIYYYENSDNGYNSCLRVSSSVDFLDMYSPEGTLKVEDGGRAKLGKVYVDELSLNSGSSIEVEQNGEVIAQELMEYLYNSKPPEIKTSSPLNSSPLKVSYFRIYRFGRGINTHELTLKVPSSIDRNYLSEYDYNIINYSSSPISLTLNVQDEDLYRFGVYIRSKNGGTVVLNGNNLVAEGIFISAEGYSSGTPLNLTAKSLFAEYVHLNPEENSNLNFYGMGREIYLDSSAGTYKICNYITSDGHQWLPSNFWDYFSYDNNIKLYNADNDQQQGEDTETEDTGKGTDLTVEYDGVRIVDYKFVSKE